MDTVENSDLDMAVAGPNSLRWVTEKRHGVLTDTISINALSVERPGAVQIRRAKHHRTHIIDSRSGVAEFVGKEICTVLPLLGKCTVPPHSKIIIQYAHATPVPIVQRML